MWDEMEDNKIKCPYCGDEIMEYWEYFERGEDGEESEIECPECEKEYDAVLDITYTIKTTKKNLVGIG